jgi:diketogulonate reductase-like aldo/keto reductase
MNIKRRSLLKALAAVTAASAGRSTLAEVQQGALAVKNIPSSGEAIPIIGIGTNRYGVADTADTLAPLKEVLAALAEAGRCVIDTAPMYGRSETVIGKLINSLGLGQDFFIATKCDVSGGEETLQQVTDSEQKLASGQLDLVAVHNLKNWQTQLPVLRQAKEKGRIRYIGVTTSRDQQYQELEKIMRNENLDFVQLNYSLADRDAEPLLQLAIEREMAVMVNLPFGRGKLFDAVRSRSLPSWAAEFDAVSWGQFFLKYVVSHPAVTCAIPGTTKLRHLQDNLNAARGRLPNAEQRNQMEGFFDSL